MTDTPENFFDDRGDVIRLAPRVPERSAARDRSSHRPLPRIADGDVARWIDKEPPEIRFAISDLMPLGMVTLLVGNGGTGKTLLQQLAGTAIAAAKPFLGKFTMSGRAVGVFAEDPDAVLHVRQFRIVEFYETSCNALGGRFFAVSFFGHDARLWQDGGPTKFLSDLESELSAIPELRLVLLDNAALLFGADENDRAQVTAFMSALNGLAARLGAAVLLSHHGSKSQDGTALRAASGSTAWINAARSVLLLEAQTEEQPPSLTIVKANHSATGERIALEWRDKLLVPAGYVGGVFGTIERRAAERVFLELLDKLQAQNRFVSDNDRAQNYAPKIFVKHPDREGYRMPDFARAMEALFASGEIVMEEYRGANRYTYRRIARRPQRGPE